MVVLEPAVFAPDRRVGAVGETILNQRLVPTQKLDPTGEFAVNLAKAGSKVVYVLEA